MNMKNHLIAALREMFEAWEEALAGLSEAQLSTPAAPEEWAVKDDLAHLWAGQQRSIARLEAALYDHAPAFPDLFAGVGSVTEESVDEINEASLGHVEWEYQIC